MRCCDNSESDEGRPDRANTAGATYVADSSVVELSEKLER